MFTKMPPGSQSPPPSDGEESNDVNLDDSASDSAPPLAALNNISKGIDKGGGRRGNDSAAEPGLPRPTAGDGGAKSSSIRPSSGLRGGLTVNTGSRKQGGVGRLGGSNKEKNNGTAVAGMTTGSSKPLASQGAFSRLRPQSTPIKSPSIQSSPLPSSRSGERERRPIATGTSNNSTGARSPPGKLYVRDPMSGKGGDVDKVGTELGLVLETPGPSHLGFSEKLGSAVKVLVQTTREAKGRKVKSMTSPTVKTPKTKSKLFSAKAKALSQGKVKEGNEFFKPKISTAAIDQFKRSVTDLKSELAFLEIEHVSTLKAIFAVLDEDQDGLLNDEQLRTAVLCTGLHPSNRLLEEIKSSVPLWIRGGVDLHTFVRIMDESLCVEQINVKDIHQLFRLFDDKGTSHISSHDLTRILQIPTSVKSELGVKEASELLSMLNISATDEINYINLAEVLSSGFINFYSR